MARGTCSTQRGRGGCGQPNVSEVRRQILRTPIQFAMHMQCHHPSRPTANILKLPTLTSPLFLQQFLFIARRCVSPFSLATHSRTYLQHTLTTLRRNPSSVARTDSGMLPRAAIALRRVSTAPSFIINPNLVLRRVPQRSRQLSLWPFRRNKVPHDVPVYFPRPAGAPKAGTFRKRLGYESAPNPNMAHFRR